MKTDDLAKWLNIPELPAYIVRVDQALEAALMTADAKLRDPALRVIWGGGKRLRPSLVIAGALSKGARVNDKVITAAAAVELLHIASLVHDDIIDHADSRRGVPTVNQKEGINSAILVGDYLVAVALAQAASVGQETASVLATAFAKMCEGQAQELADNFNVDRSIDDYLLTIKNKTAVLMAAACEIGGLCAELTDKQVGALRDYGEAYGMTFQLADDMLDFLSTSKASGKPVANDVKQGVYTLPVLLSINGSSKLPAPETMVQTMLADGSFRQTVTRAQQYNQQAAGCLRSLPPSTVVSGLSELPGKFLHKVMVDTELAGQLMI